MTDRRINNIAIKFRGAIEAAHKDGRFAGDTGFKRFPHGSCGETSYILSHYLSTEHGIQTIWASYERGDWSHAWLVVNDDRVSDPTTEFYQLPDDMKDTLNLYSGGRKYDEPIDITRYKEENIINGLIIDITGDQFDDYNIPVFIGTMDRLHRSFKFNQAHTCNGLIDGRTYHLYQTIKEYL